MRRLRSALHRLLYTYGQSFHALRRLEIRAIDAMLAAAPGESVLDVGCGKGAYCRRLERRGASVWGVDPGLGNVHPARMHQPAGIRFQAGFGEALPYADGSFDKVVSVCVLEHTLDDRGVLREVHRVLRPGGTFVCSVDALNSRLLGEAYRREHARRFRCNRFYAQEPLRAKLSAAGFDVSSIRGLFASVPAQWVIRAGAAVGFGAPFVAAFPLVYPVLAADRFFGDVPGEEFILVASSTRPA